MLHRIICAIVIMVTLLGQHVMPDDWMKLEDYTRLKRDGYMGNSYGGAGSYGCSCPYQSCDNGINDGILYFGAGALLGLFFSMLFPATMMMAAGGGAGGGGRRLSTNGTPDFKPNFNLPHLIGDEVAPLAIELMQVYSERHKRPECSRRWLCEITKNALTDERYNSIAASLSR